MKKKTQFLLNLALTAIFLILILFQGPNLNPLYPDGAFSWCFIISCYLVLNFFVALGSVREPMNTAGPKSALTKVSKAIKEDLSFWPSFGPCISEYPSCPCLFSITRPTGTS